MASVLVRLLKIFEFLFVYSTRAILFIAASRNYFLRPKRCPKITDKLLLIPARDLANMIRQKEVTSESVVSSYISRIKIVNPIINAVVEDRFDVALKEAKRIDAMLLTTKMTTNELKEKYPLLGIPLSVKECIALEGGSHSSGAVLYQPRVAKIDAPSVKLCKDAGAIPIALTNTPELCLNFESYNSVTGLSRNPYDTRRTTAGSSGGEAALLGAGGSVIGLGSDLFGSIRIPASFCGVWGHKPSPNLVPLEGLFPNCESNLLWEKCCCIGPMARYATDLSLLLQVMAKKPWQYSKDQIDLKDVKVYYLENNFGTALSHPIDQEIVLALHKTVEFLSKKFCCRKTQLLDFQKYGKYALPVLLSLIYDANVPFNESQCIKKLLQYCTGSSNHTIWTVFYLIGKRVPAKYIRYVSKTCTTKLEKMKSNICNLLGKNGVLLFPTHPTSATFHYQSCGKFEDYIYTGIFNFLGLPVTQCPMGLTKNGLPIGIQVVSTPGNDVLTLAIAEEIEKVFGGWIPPPSV